jgi:hypothetical protein
MIPALSDAGQRAALGTSLVAALDKVYADESLSLTDRLDTTFADVALSKANGKVPPAVLDKVRRRAAWADANAKDLMTRQAVISDAAQLLDMAGDFAGAKKLLTAELKRSKQPYYYMLDLSQVAEDQGDAKAAVDWAHKAYEAAEGPATRVQWAVDWSNTVMRLTPKDKAAVTTSANAVLAELAKSPDSYYQRTRVKVGAWGDKLRAWSEKNGGADLLADRAARWTQSARRKVRRRTTAASGRRRPDSERQKTVNGSAHFLTGATAPGTVALETGRERSAPAEEREPAVENPCRPFRRARAARACRRLARPPGRCAGQRFRQARLARHLAELRRAREGAGRADDAGGKGASAWP